jgi:hypothetical protein
MAHLCGRSAELGRLAAETFPMSGQATSALGGAVLGLIAGAVSIAGVLSATGAVVATIVKAGVPQCATGGAIVGAIAGAIAGAVGGVIGGGSRGATGLPSPVARTAAASAFAALVVLLLVWGPLPERLVILALVLPGLWGGVAIGDRAAKRVVQVKPKPPGLLRGDLDA